MTLSQLSSDYMVSKLILPHTSLELSRVLMPMQFSNWLIMSCTSTYHKWMINEKTKTLLHRMESVSSVWLRLKSFFVFLFFWLFIHRESTLSLWSLRVALNVECKGFNNPNLFSNSVNISWCSNQQRWYSALSNCSII